VANSNFTYFELRNKFSVELRNEIGILPGSVAQVIKNILQSKRKLRVHLCR